MKFRVTDAPRVAAAKASFSTASGYRFEQDGRLPSHKVPVRTRRRPDPLADIFDTEVVPMLTAAPGLRAVAVLEELQGAITILLRASDGRWNGGSGRGGRCTVLTAR